MPKERIIVKFRALPFILLSCCAGMNQAQASGYLPPRLSMEANAGGSATVGQADLLWSLKGDERRTLYLDPQVAYGSDEQWYSDLGLGYRWIQNEAAILGGYLFAGRSQVANHSGFWIANPGVEALGSRWDARINGYIPVGGRSNDLGIFQTDVVSQSVFSGHSIRINSIFSSTGKTQQVGNGVDAKVDYQLFRDIPFKAYLGGYFFDIANTDNVRGGAAGVEYWFDRTVKVFAHYTYDNLQHNTLVGGLAVSFGGVDEARADPSLSERLTDPVERDLANLGHGSGIPSKTTLYDPKQITISNFTSNFDSSSQLISSSAVFFSQTGRPVGAGLSLSSCTFENPCASSDFSQATINTLNALFPNTQILFNGGTYAAMNGASPLTLNNGQGLYGRTADYSAAASGAARPQFNGAFILADNNTLDNIILLPTPVTASGYGVTVQDATNLLITGSQIGNSLADSFIGGITFLGASQGVVQDSQVFGADQAAVTVAGTSNVLIQGSTLNAVLPDNAYTGGLLMVNSAVVDIENSSVNVTDNISAVSGGVSNGIVALDTATFTAHNVQVNVINQGDGQINGIVIVERPPFHYSYLDSSVINITGAGVNSLAVGPIIITNSSCIKNGVQVIPCK